METQTVIKRREPLILKTLVLPLSLYKLVEKVANSEEITDNEAIRLLIQLGYEETRKKKANNPAKSPLSPQP